MSIMKTIFNFGNNRNSRKMHSSAMRFRPQLEPLEDRQLLAVASLLSTAVTGSLPSPGSFSEMDLELASQNGTAPVVGIRVDATSAGFNPSAITVFDSNGSPVGNSAVKYSNPNFGGTTSSLLVIQLEPGDYTIRVGGDNSTYGSFTCDVFLPGDLNHDGTVDRVELLTADALFQSSRGKMNSFTIAALKAEGIIAEDLKVSDEIDIDGDGKISLYESDAVAANSLAGKVTVDVFTMADRPELSARILNTVTGSGNTLFTSNPVISGNVTNVNSNVALKASFNGTDWADVTLNADGSFTVDANLMKNMTGSPIDANGSVVNGKFNIQLKIIDRFGEQDPVSLGFVAIKSDAQPKANNKNDLTTGEKEALTGSLSSLVSHDFTNYQSLGGTFTFVTQNITLDSGATLVVQANGNYTYTPGNAFIHLNVGDTATETFTYTVKDLMGKSATGTITITINGENDPPVAADISETTNQNTIKTIDVISKASDPDNTLDELTISSVTQPSKGEVKIVDNKLTFDPKDAFKHLPQGQSEKVTFSYTIRDPGGLTSTKTVTMTVTGLNDAPIAANVTASVNADGAAVSIDVVAKCTAVDDGSTVELVEIVSGPAKGTATIVDGKISFNPNGQFSNVKQGETEAVTFTYRVKNSLDATKTSTATVTVTVTGVNNPPIITGDYNAPAIAKNGTLEINESVLINLAVDPNGDSMTVSRVESATSGVTVKIENGKVIYNPGATYVNLKAGQNATDEFLFWVKDEKGAESILPGKVNITINGFNSPLAINNQTLSIVSSGAGDKQCAVQLSSVGHNDKLLYEIVGTVTGGPGGTMPTFTINPDTGVITVSKNNLPDTTGTGNDYVMTVKVTDKDNTSDAVTAQIRIQVVTKNPPVVPSSPLKLTTAEDAKTAVTGTITGVTNDGPFTFNTALVALSFKIDGTTYDIPTGYTASVNANTGVVSFNPNGKFDLIPAGKNGILILQYTVKDTATGVSSTGTVEITITGVNSPPYLKEAIPNQTTDQNTSKTLNVRTYFDDPDVGDVLKVKTGSVTVTGGGTVSINGSGNIVFNPGNDFKHLPVGQTAEATVSFVIEDTGGLTVNGSFKIIVSGLNDAPVVPENITGPETTKNTATGAIQVLANATDPDDGETATLVIGWVGRGTQGKAVAAGETVTFTEGDSVTVSSNGKTLTYNPGTRYLANGTGTNATATFEFQAKDVQGALSNKGTVSVLVKGADEAPTVNPEKFADYWKSMGEVVEMNFATGGYFGGQNLTFTVEIDGVAIAVGSTGKDSAEMLECTWNGTKLTIRFTENYHSQDNRNLVPITVTATNGGGASASYTFGAATKPTVTAEIKLIAVDIDDSISNGRATSFDAITAGDGSYKVGDKFYLEIWAVDLANQVVKEGFSFGIGTISNTLAFNGQVVKITLMDIELSERFVLEDTAVAHNLTSADAYIEKIGGGLTANNVGLPGYIFRSARIMVEVIGEGDANFRIVQDDKFLLSRKTDNEGDQLKLNVNQVDLWAQTVTCASASAPLLGQDRPEVIAEGGVYSRVVTQPTTVASDGSVADIPANADWIHEWQTHWVELWVKASDAMYFTEAGCTLNYNSDYFTATDVELSPAFAGTSKAIINDALGQVTGIGGDATRLVKSDGYILLGRVKFESLGTDNVPFEEAFFAHDLGIRLSNVMVRSSTNESFSRVGNSPKTELWAVPYDVNDSGIITLEDFMFFENAFRQSGKSNTMSYSVFDYTKTGYVTLDDFVYFANAFGDYRGSGKEVKFPATFTQRYVGKTLDADSAATVNKIIDAANKAWQTALGLERPVEIQIVVQDFGAGNSELANARITAVDAQGRPLKGIVTLDSTAAGMGWYSQITEPVANGRYDLYTTLLHEMGHIYGFNTSYDAFNAVVGQYVGQLDASMLHAADSNDLLYATLATGVRKYISAFDVAIITSAYDAAQADSSLGFRNSTAAITAGESMTPDATAFVAQENGSLVTMLNLPVFALTDTPQQGLDSDTALKLHAMGLAVALPITMQVREESRISFTVEQIYNDDGSFFDLTDDDLMSLHLSQDVDESELALIDLTMDLNV